MSDDDLIRRGDALAAAADLYRWSIAAGEELEAAIAALPPARQEHVADSNACGVGVPTEEDREWIDARADELFRANERIRGSVRPSTIRPQDFRDYFVVNATLERFAALPARGVGVKAPFYFDRYINGVQMAEGVCVERETTLEGAMRVSARIAAKGPNGEVPVLVYRAHVTPALGLKRIGTGLYETQSDYRLAPHLQKIVDGAKAAPQWDTQADRLAPTDAAQAPAEDAHVKGETAGQMLERLGMDGAKWAAEFRTTALRLGYSDMDEGWLVGWFCNAIMAGHDRSAAQAREAALLQRAAQLAYEVWDDPEALEKAILALIGEAHDG